MDLNAPLGRSPKRPRRNLVPLVVGLVAALIVGGLGLTLYRADPNGGEPYAVAVIPSPPPTTPAPASKAAIDPTPTGSIGNPASSSDGVRMENGVKIVSPRTGTAAARDTGPLIIDVTKALDGAKRGGSSPSSRTSAAAAPMPRIAIFVGGMGIDRLATQTAIESMPAAVSFAFLPGADSRDDLLAAARARGHELLLQLPMESAQGTAATPHTLRADESQAELTHDLAWLLDRYSGYVGVTNMLGAPVTANRSTMTTILEGVRRRGVFYLDDGTSRRSIAGAVAAGLNMPAAQADVVLDATADPSVVRANLDRLVTIARAKGSAIGMATGFPDHLPAIARFAAELDGKGLTLVPVSAIARGGATFATTR